MVHAHEMGPDALTKLSLNLDTISENVLAEVMDVFAFKFLGEVGVDIDVLQFPLLQDYGVCVCVCGGGGGGGGDVGKMCVSILEVLQFLP